jgi:hypothetical protein
VKRPDLVARWKEQLLGHLLLNSWFHLAVGVTALVAGALTGAWTGEWHWFQRTGAVATLMGGLITLRDILSEFYFEHRGRREARLHPPGSHTPQEMRWLLAGVTLAHVGTFVWGFGDLVERIV